MTINDVLSQGRGSLSDFQKQLFGRLQLAKAGGGAESDSKLGVWGGSAPWLLDLRHIAEIAPVPVVVEVPLTRDWYLGLSSIRGSLVNVIDLARFLGQDRTRMTGECKVVVMAHWLEVCCGLLVSKISGLHNLSDMVSVSVNGAGGWHKKWYRDASGTAWCLPDLASLAADRDFLDVAR